MTLGTRPDSSPARRRPASPRGGWCSRGLLAAAVSVLCRRRGCCGLWRGDLGVPLRYTPVDDTKFYLMLVKGIVDHGWYASNPSLGAPFGQQLVDYPQGADSLNLLLIRAARAVLLEPRASHQPVLPGDVRAVRLHGPPGAAGRWASARSRRGRRGGPLLAARLPLLPGRVPPVPLRLLRGTARRPICSCACSAADSCSRGARRGGAPDLRLGLAGARR